MTTEPRNDLSRSIDAAEFQAQCMSVIDDVAETGEAITITKDGQPVLRLVPCSAEEPTRNGPPFPSPVGMLRGQIKIAEDFDIVYDSVLDDDWEEQMDRDWDEYFS